jgi:UDP-glucose 4-epimerase
MHKRILVTGGAGFIGSAIIKQLQSSGQEIFVLDNLSFGNKSFISIPDNHFFENDIRDREKVFQLFHKIQPDSVLHLAAIHFIPYCNQHPFEAADINIRGTINILDAAKATGSVKQLFFASTAAVYPICDEAISENFDLQPLDIYGITKLAGERLCHEFHLATGIPSIICRFFNAFGPNETNPHLIPEIQQQVNEGKRSLQLGNLDPKRDFIHTADMASAIEALLEKFHSGIDCFNLGRGIEYSVKEVVAAFEAELNEKLDIQTDPSRVRKVERMHLLANIDKLKSYTGWEPRISLKEGIRTLINQ